MYGGMDISDAKLMKLLAESMRRRDDPRGSELTAVCPLLATHGSSVARATQRPTSHIVLRIRALGATNLESGPRGSRKSKALGQKCSSFARRKRNHIAVAARRGWELTIYTVVYWRIGSVKNYPIIRIVCLTRNLADMSACAASNGALCTYPSSLIAILVLWITSRFRKRRVATTTK